jgi:8-oxo-dGTP pyrophosphatase MutT (NUDIX family)
MAREERSAGVVLFRVDPATSERLYLLLDYGRHWDFPKGHLHKNESDRDAALRETREETGVDDVRLVPGFFREISYFFRSSKHGLIRKSVGFFAGQTDGEKVTLSDEHTGYAFLPYSQALARLTFANARQVLEATEAHLSANKH